jgi:hypothetical protein
MMIVLAVITALAALAALRVPEQYMEPGAARILAQIAAVILALYLGAEVARHGPPPPGPFSFMQWVVVAILLLGAAMRVFLGRRKK